MDEEYNNRTDGRFDLWKEEKIVADFVVDALTHSKMLLEENSDEATRIVAKQFFIFRNYIALQPIGDIKQESMILARRILRLLIDANLIAQQDHNNALEVITEEILVRRSMEGL